MKIANLLEATGPVIAFSWGRFQPPHLGHAQVFKKVASVGKDGYWICTSQSKDPKKNPLDYETKVALLKEMFPQYADHILYDPNVKTIYDAITSIYNKMDPKAAEQTTLVFVGDPERIGDFQEGFRKYNGVPMRNGYYKFKDITTFPNTDAADIRATDVRGAASSGDFNKFMQLTGTKGTLAKKVYNAVRAGMGVDNKKLKEDIGYNFYELIKGPAMLNLYDKMHHAKMKNKDMLKYVLDNIWYMKKIDPKTLRSIRQKFYQDPFGRNLHIDQKQIQHYINLMKHYQNIDPVVIGPSGSIIDGNHRVRAAAELGKPIVAYVAVNENVAEKDLDVPTPTVQDLAKKYRKTVKQVNIELAKGIKVEMEHTTDVEVAREIALDHLNEKLDYYTELAGIEEGWKSKVAGAAMMGLGALSAAGAAKASDQTTGGGVAPAQAAQSIQWLDDPSIPDDLPGKVAGSRYPTKAAVGTKYGSFINAKGEKINAYVDHDLTSRFVPAKDGEWKPQNFPTNAPVGTKYGTFIDKDGKKWDKYVGPDLTPVFKPAAESIAEAWSKKYKKSINCNNPKGFSQRAHCAGRKARRAGKKTKSGSVSEDVINELANEPYRYMLWKRTMMGNSYLFQTDGGQEIVVSMVPETLADGTHRVEVMFADKATFGLEKTGKGDAFRIFATVAQILKDYIKEAKFEVGEIYFTGKTKEPSRIKLYDKIARRLGQHIPGFEFYGAGDNSVEKGYIFKKTGGEQVKEEVIDEVSMSPGSLKKFAATDFAKSMTVGFEAEMAIEDMEEDEPNYDDIEPDWDMDEVVSFDRNWHQQITRFFTGGESNNSRREVERVLEGINEEYYEWISEQYQEWLDSDESRDTIVKFLKDYDSDISDEDIEDTVKFKKNNYWGSIENDVREDWEADNMGDDSFREFMEYAEYDTMRGIYDKFAGDISWPYYTEPEYSGGNVSYEDIESDFVEKTGYTATVSRGYHSAARKPGVWIFEPDSSISPAGVELVSPPMPLDEGLKALDDFFAWAKSYGAEANESTGFHMGVSIPEQTMDNVDHLKLILFLGDEYVLKQFGRESNSYARSSLDKIRGQLRSPTANVQELLANFKQGLNSEAAKVTRGRMLPKGDRYVSVNIKENYVEFRSAGGNYFEKIPEIKNTMLRYVRAMAIAADPEAEKNEYAKKLYKLMATAFPDDIDSIKYFSGYAAGTITRSELKAMVNYARSERQRKAAPATPPKTYEIYLIGTDYVFHTFTARDDEEANDIATDWARQRNKTDWDVRLSEPKPLPMDRAQRRAAETDPTLTTYSAKYRDQNDVERSIGITASNYSQAQEQYMNLRRAYPHISFIGLQTNTNPQDAEDQRRRAAAAAGSTVGGQPAAQASTEHDYKTFMVNFTDPETGEEDNVALIADSPEEAEEKFRRIFPRNMQITGISLHTGDEPTESLDETRQGAYGWLKTYLPNWPEYVLRDWIYRGLTKHDPNENPKEVVDRMLAGEGMSAQTQWKLIPNFEFKLEKLHPDTQRRIKMRAGGSANPMNVPKDAERHATQAALAKQQGGVRKEPVIGKMTAQGFELIEGWHRTIQHFNQFPAGYQGPAWVATNATAESLDEMLKKVKGKWALVSRHNPKKVLQYYHGSGHPSKEWVNKVERRVQAFKHMEEAEEMKPAIFIDMDGTIADFFGEWAKLDGKDHYKDIEHKEDALDLVREHPTFWIDLPLLPNARELVKAAIDLYGEYYICSKPLEHDPKSAPGKLAWIQKHFGDMPPKDVFFTDNKGAYAQMGGRPNVLIDDFGKYVDAWKAAGGIAIKYRPERFPEVLELLRKLAK